MEIANNKVFDDYELVCKIYPTELCNYRCTYCYDPGRCGERLPLKHRLYNIKEKYKNALLKNTFLEKKCLNDLNTDKIIASIQKLNKNAILCFSGGEPFLFPKFIEKCKDLTKEFDIKVTTNLSHRNVYKFADEIDPEKVYVIICSFHINQVEKFNHVDDFIPKVKYFREKRFATSVVCVMHHPIFKKFLSYHKLFKSHDIDLLPVVFEGIYNSKTYPESYSKSEKELIIKYSKYESKHIQYQNTYFGSNNFKGKECLAGKSFIAIYPDGNVYRCVDDKKYLGHLGKGNIKLFKKVKKCRMNKCGGPSWGYRLTTK